MEGTLEYAPPEITRPVRFLRATANITLVYPLLCIVLLYVNWIIAACIIGHIPRPTLDDPKSITGVDWIFGLTAISFLGIVPMAILGLVFNLWYVTRKGSHHGSGRRVALFVAIWIGSFAFLVLDPFRVMTWWFD